jgi:UDP-3-O-acyl-N-acetylglucosamine deacetylase
MTDLKKPVRRRTIGLHRGRRIMVSLEPGDVLCLRQERCRQVEYLSIPALYDYAVKARVIAERAAKKKAR